MYNFLALHSLNIIQCETLFFKTKFLKSINYIYSVDINLTSPIHLLYKLRHLVNKMLKKEKTNLLVCLYKFIYIFNYSIVIIIIFGNVWCIFFNLIIAVNHAYSIFIHSKHFNIIYRISNAY